MIPGVSDDYILNMLRRRSAGLTDRELAARLKGRGSAPELVSTLCHRLEAAGRVQRVMREDGEVVNIFAGAARPAAAVGASGRDPAAPSGARAAPVDEVALRLHWTEAGAVRWDEAGLPVFPAAPRGPALWRLRFAHGDQMHVEAALDLRQRLRDCRAPGVGRRVHARLVVARDRDEAAWLDVCRRIELITDGAPAPCALTEPEVSLLCESAARVEARRAGWRLLTELRTVS